MICSILCDQINARRIFEMERGSAERKSIKFQDQATVTITVVGRLSEARKLILATGAVVLLDRYQRKGKSIVMFSAGPPLQVFRATKEVLLRMTELVEVDGEQKNELLKLGPEVTQRIVCYEVENRFASLMRQIESVC